MRVSPTEANGRLTACAIPPKTGIFLLAEKRALIGEKANPAIAVSACKNFPNFSLLVAVLGVIAYSLICPTALSQLFLISVAKSWIVFLTLGFLNCAVSFISFNACVVCGIAFLIPFKVCLGLVNISFKNVKKLMI